MVPDFWYGYVASSHGSTEEHPDDVGLSAEYGESTSETSQPVLVPQVEAEGEQDHAGGHLVSVVEVTVEIQDWQQGDVDAAP